MSQSSLESSKLSSQLWWLIAFSIAMGFLEAAVVIYLRLLYYPSGFQFPLVPLDERASVVEVLREAATVVMLVGFGAMAGKNFQQRLAFFLLAFAIWDLFYYVFLKAVLNWAIVMVHVGYFVSYSSSLGWASAFGCDSRCHHDCFRLDHPRS